MSQVRLNMSDLLNEAFTSVGPIFMPLVLLQLPVAVLQVVAVVLPGPLHFVVDIVSLLTVVPTLDGAAIYLIHRHLNHRQTDADVYDVYEALQLSDGKAADLIVANFLASAIATIGVIFLLIPGIYLAFRLVFVPYAVTLEDNSPIEAISTSWCLTEGHWWGIFGCLLGAVVVAAAVPLIVIVILAIPIENDLITQLLTSGLGLMLAPVFRMYVFLMYRNFTIRG